MVEPFSRIIVYVFVRVCLCVHVNALLRSAFDITAWKNHLHLKVIIPFWEQSLVRGGYWESGTAKSSLNAIEWLAPQLQTPELKQNAWMEPCCSGKARNLNYPVQKTPHIQNKYKQIKLRWALFVTYTIIQSIMRSEMCSLHLTHPSVHTWSSGQPTVQRPGSSRGLPVGAGIRTHNLGLPQVSSPTLYPLGQRLPFYARMLEAKDLGDLFRQVF